MTKIFIRAPGKICRHKGNKPSLEIIEEREGSKGFTPLLPVTSYFGYVTCKMSTNLTKRDRTQILDLTEITL